MKARSAGMKEVSIQLSSGKSQLSVSGRVEELVRENGEPLLAWAEPMAIALTGNAADRHRAFELLVAGKPAWPSHPPLGEARLFWTDRAVHVVAAPEQGCRWAMVSETAVGFCLRLGFLFRLRFRRAMFRQRAAGVGKPMIKKVLRAESPVLTLRDADRFGLDKANWMEQTYLAIEYRDNGRLVAWRLLPKESDGG